MGKHWHIQLSHPTLGERQGFSWVMLTNKEECDLMKDCPSIDAFPSFAFYISNGVQFDFFCFLLCVILLIVSCFVLLLFSG